VDEVDTHGYRGYPDSPTVHRETVMRLLYIVGYDAGRPINVDLDRLRQGFPDLEITKNSLPKMDGAAFYDLGNVSTSQQEWADETPRLVGSGTLPPGIKARPLTGPDFFTQVKQDLEREELDAPAEEGPGFTPEGE